MSARLVFNIFKQFIFWLAFFQLGRLVFLVYNAGSTIDAGIGDAALSLWHALPLDISMACYFLVLPFLLIILYSFFKYGIFLHISRFYSFLMMFLFSLIISGELGLYDEWHTKLNMKAISFLSHPTEVINTAKGGIIILTVVLTAILTAAGIYCYNRFIFEKQISLKRNRLVAVIFFIVISLALLTGMRGGYGPVPIQVSSAYYSKNQFLNLAATNSVWNLLSSVEKNWKYKNSNPFEFYDDDKARAVVDSLYSTEKDTTVMFLKNKRPNVVLIIFEGWSADVVGSLSDLKDITPEFDSLASKGILFTNQYCSGIVSAQGICAILSGFPSQPETSIINQPDKYGRLPCINKEFLNAGYYTSFLFGGELEYGNIRGYIYFNQFDAITEQTDFDKSVPRGRLGVQDGDIYDRLLKDLNTYKEPFFSVVFTISSHSPYDNPATSRKFETIQKEKDYVRSVYYSDSCLGSFIRSAQKEKWFDNTLFIMLSDHQHVSPQGREWQKPDSRRIPMLFYGPAILPECRGKHIDLLCSQTDLAATLLAQLEMPREDFGWSKDLMNRYSKEFVFYSFDYGIGWVTPDFEYFVYDYDLQTFFHERYVYRKKEDLMKEGQSYLQVLFEEYLAY